jgi:hypothetical protein
MSNLHVNFLSTAEVSQILKIKGNTIRRAYCLSGHYMNVKPRKLPNGRLLWPKTELLEAAGLHELDVN